MNTRVKQRKSRTNKPTIELDLELFHDVLDVIGYFLHPTTEEGPRHDSRGREVWEGGPTPDLEDIFKLETKLKGLLRQREIDAAVAAALAERDQRPAAVRALEGGKSGRVVSGSSS